MNYTLIAGKIASRLLGIIIFIIGVSNLLLVHPVPGIIFLVISSLYLPQTNAFLKKRLGFAIPNAVKIILGFIIIWFTLGVSDLGDMIDNL